MLLKDAEDLASFVSELQRESDRGLPLVAGALIDELLQESLRAFFIASSTVDKLLDEATGPLSTFSARSKTCFALGLIDSDEYHEVELIRKIRNEFAHAKHGKRFSDARIHDLCFSFKTKIAEGFSSKDPRSRFLSAVVATVLHLYYRPQWAALERRQPKTWLPEDPRWRSVQEELPPEGVSVLGLAKDDKGNQRIVVVKRTRGNRNE